LILEEVVEVKAISIRFVRVYCFRNDPKERINFRRGSSIIASWNPHLKVITTAKGRKYVVNKDGSQILPDPNRGIF